MGKHQQIDFEGIEKLPVRVFAEKAYLDYSMYVILDRALPHIGDGLKPVHRRIIYAMSELGLSATSKPKKSARTVGDVIGKFHPHGDTACYEAMVLMAQDFTYRYPLIDGHGNWGSQDDPKSFAAMRYTESRLAPYARVLLQELALGTVDWVPNYDGTFEEPSMLPARLPNVLLNGATGIAVGMSTDIPPHNLREVVSACIRLLEEPRSTVEDLCEHIKGPDYPTDAEIISRRDDLLKLYSTGTGMVRARARFEIENGDIVITALPHQVSGARVLEQIAQQMQAKKLPMVEDLRDESDHEQPTRLVIVTRSNRINLQALMLHLFATTDLERSYRVNMNMIGADGRPRVKNLLNLLKEWLDFRTQTVRRRLQSRLDKVEERLHILAGLLIAFLNIDEVIAIIRHEDEPKPVLIMRFRLTDTQAEEILNLRLRHLARLEEIKIRAEQDELAAERDTLNKTLGSNQRLKTLIRNELLSDAETYGDARRSPIVERNPAQALDETALIPAELVTIILSQKGWVRSAKGHDFDPATLAYKPGDTFQASVLGRSNQAVIFLDSTGRCYVLPAHGLPSARGQGEPLSGRLNPPEGAAFISLFMDDVDQNWFLTTDAGYGFICKVEDMQSRNKAGKAILSVPAGVTILPPLRIRNSLEDRIVAITSDGYMLVTVLDGMPLLAKGKGNKFINIPAAKLKLREEFLVAVVLIKSDDVLTLFCGKKHKTMKAAELEEYAGDRGRRGKKLPRGFQKVDFVRVGV